MYKAQKGSFTLSYLKKGGQKRNKVGSPEMILLAHK